MTYTTKNSSIILDILKIQYRDSKRIKFKYSIYTKSGILMEWYKNTEVPPDFFQKFKEKAGIDSEDLIKLDQEKETWEI